MIAEHNNSYYTPRQATLIVTEMLRSRRLVLGLAAVVVLAYLPELANPTFSTDYFFDISFLGSTTYAFALDGRYLAELIRNICGRMFPPTLLLIVGIILLMLSGLLACIMLRVRHWFPALIACGLFATFPLFFETFAYHAIRHIVPLGIFLSMFAVVHGGIYRRWRPTLIGVGGIYFALMLYQSTIYVAVTMTVFAAGLRLLGGERPIATAVDYVFPRAAATVVALFLYSVTVRFGGPLLGVPADRLQSFATFSSSFEEFRQAAGLVLRAIYEILVVDTFLFPVYAKWAFLLLAGLLGLGVLQSRRTAGGMNMLLATGLFALTPLLVFGAAWASRFPANMLADRILISFVAVYVGVFLVAWSTNLYARKWVAVTGAFILCIFIYQSNLWHLYMDLKNRADMDIASQISEQIKSQSGYRPWMPLVLIGTNDAKDYQPYRTFPIARQTLTNSSLVSAFGQAWSASRVLIFFLPFTGPSPDQVARMTELTKGNPAWPDPRSVVIADDVVAVVLGR